MRFTLDLYGRGYEECLSMDQSFPTLSDKIYILQVYDAAKGSKLPRRVSGGPHFLAQWNSTSESTKIDHIWISSNRVDPQYSSV